jgi:hypothetical protein
MASPTTICMTLTGPYEGVTKIFGKYQFVDGKCLFVGSQEQCESVARYFTRSYQVKVDIVTAESLIDKAKAEKEEKEAAQEEAARVDDSDVISDEELEEKEAEQNDPTEPNSRQAAIIAAVNQIDKDQWVDKHAATPRPKVGDVAEAMDDPTVSKKEIVEVIRTWLS